MRRLEDGITIRYGPGDRVKLLCEGKLLAATILFPPEHKDFQTITGQRTTVTVYRVRLDNGERVYVRESAIVKQADTGGIGVVRHLEAF